MKQNGSTRFIVAMTAMGILAGGAILKHFFPGVSEALLIAAGTVATAYIGGASYRPSGGANDSKT